MDMEIYAGNGGQDALAFAVELADAIGRAAGVTPVSGGKTVRLHRL